MSRDTFNVPTAGGWALIGHVQIVKPNGEQASLTSHEINGLDNETADKGGEAMVDAMKQLVNQWQEMKKKGYPKG